MAKSNAAFHPSHGTHHPFLLWQSQQASRSKPHMEPTALLNFSAKAKSISDESLCSDEMLRQTGHSKVSDNIHINISYTILFNRD